MTTFDTAAACNDAAPAVQNRNAAPTWVPKSALRYLAHIEAGLPIRALARHAGCHASTILRQIRKLENRRDDFLVDEALRQIGVLHFRPEPRRETGGRRPMQSQFPLKEHTTMTTDLDPQPDSKQTTVAVVADAPGLVAPSNEMLRREGRRVLRRLAEPGAVLAVAAEMDKAVVVRDGVDGTTTRTAVVERAIAQAMALKEWIVCDTPGRVSRYRITAAGRAALGTLLAEAENTARRDISEGGARFSGPDLVDDAADDTDDEARGGGRRRMRYCVNESPLLSLARRRDKSGKPFLSDELVTAGERLREDFELAQMGPKVAQNWDRFLTAGVQGGALASGAARGPEAARARISAALRDLGPGLGDVALRCCCYLEGLEQAERRMGWSARSGKIVLRIALQRLRRHYDDLGKDGSMIG
ncbi:MAG: helix-turn-helix domain-containing protein [Rhodobacterales bacterium]|nr:helix-turn-helix domain-containing protein [Rhodobacterales bacterium]MDX5390476.1 helix-turn-helix domain-containing protein [Rhodobacterales bacterium]MDX5490171.1 helix-turn-helix domain-containing protein [Rhodobacterales bacterium]